MFHVLGWPGHICCGFENCVADAERRPESSPYFVTNVYEHGEFPLPSSSNSLSSCKMRGVEPLVSSGTKLR